MNLLEQDLSQMNLAEFRPKLKFTTFISHAELIEKLQRVQAVSVATYTAKYSVINNMRLRQLITGERPLRVNAFYPNLKTRYLPLNHTKLYLIHNSNERPSLAYLSTGNLVEPTLIDFAVEVPVSSAVELFHAMWDAAEEVKPTTPQKS